jgi:hypothetical protein
MQLMVRGLVVELCKFGRFGFGTASGGVRYGRHDGNGIERVHYCIRIYMWFIEARHTCLMMCCYVML